MKSNLPRLVVINAIHIECQPFYFLQHLHQSQMITDAPHSFMCFLLMNSTMLSWWSICNSLIHKVWLIFSDSMLIWCFGALSVLYTFSNIFRCNYRAIGWWFAVASAVFTHPENRSLSSLNRGVIKAPRRRAKKDLKQKMPEKRQKTPCLINRVLEQFTVCHKQHSNLLHKVMGQPDQRKQWITLDAPPRSAFRKTW